IRPFNPFCGTVSKPQFAALYGKASPNGVVIRQLSFRPPASSSATDVPASSDSRPATAQPPEPAPTTTKSNVSVTDVSPCIHSFRHCERKRSNPDLCRGGILDCFAALAMTGAETYDTNRIIFSSRAILPP